MSKLMQFFFIFIVFGSCSNLTSQRVIDKVPNDTSQSIWLGDYWIIPKTTFDFNSLGKTEGDTIDFITCSDFVYSPFGKLKERQDLKTSRLKDFEIYESKKDTSTITYEEGGKSYFFWHERLKLKYGSNTLNLSFDDGNEGEKHSYIIDGEIISNDIVFINGVRIEMNMDDFCLLFFDSFPKELQDKYKVITFITCTDGLRHIYTFKNKKLFSISFKGTF